MSLRKTFEVSIIENSKILNTKGYVLKNEHNLIDGVNLELFHKDLMQGSGNELIKKFNALYSSSALAVNNFAIVKKHLEYFSYQGYSRFVKSTFERQFKTGLKGTPPNIDFVIENQEVIIAFESKYLELLDAKEVKFKESYDKNNLKYLDNYWFKLIEEYIGKTLYLDVAQLIKHSIGLINYKKNYTSITPKKVILIYIYWTPQNMEKFEVYKEHIVELDHLKELYKNQNDIDFNYLSYHQFWNLFNEVPIYNEHFKKIKTRYHIDIK